GLVCRPKPLEERVRGEERSRAEAAGYHHDLWVWHRAERLVRDHRELAAVGSMRSGLDRHEAHARAGQAREDLVGADRIESGDAVEQGDRDVHDVSLTTG